MQDPLHPSMLPKYKTCPSLAETKLIRNAQHVWFQATGMISLVGITSHESQADAEKL